MRADGFEPQRMAGRSAQAVVTEMIKDVQKDAQALDQKMLLARTALQSFMRLRSSVWGTEIAGDLPVGSAGARFSAAALAAWTLLGLYLLLLIDSA